MQHVIHDGKALYSVRETREDTVVSSAHGATVSVMVIDVDRNAKPDLLLLLKGGRTAEAYLVEKDGFLSPAPAQILFNKGEKNFASRDCCTKRQNNGQPTRQIQRTR
jgi:hypothetical protein